MQGSGTKSMLGYSRNSPYKNDPFIDIFTPEGMIDMSNTDKDLVGIDEYGNTQLMLANSGNPYMFPGQQVREIPISKAGGLSPAKAKEMLKDNSANGKKLTKAQIKYFQAVAHGWKPSKQTGGVKNPYQVGGTLNDLFNFLFEDDEQSSSSPDMPTAPSIDELDEREAMLNERQKQLDEQEQYNLAMQIAGEDFSPSNPYVKRQKAVGQSNADGTPFSFPAAKQSGTVNPYVIQSQNDLMSKYKVGNLGIWGDEAHQKRASDHNTGDAQDFTFDSPQTADAAIAQLMKEAKERKVKYIVYNGRIWNPSISPDWRPYKGTNPHKSHFHVSYNR